MLRILSTLQIVFFLKALLYFTQTLEKQVVLQGDFWDGNHLKAQKSESRPC